jgi:hypothetical protein
VNIAINNFVKNINIHSIITVKNGKIRFRFMRNALSPVARKEFIYLGDAIIANSSFVMNMLSHLIMIVKILRTGKMSPPLQELQQYQQMENFIL